MDRLRRLHRDYSDRAEFLFVYICETDHDTPELDQAVAKQGLRPDDPDYSRQRLLVGLRLYDLTMPCLRDGPDRATQRAYGAWPQRLVLIDPRGRVAWDAGWSLQRGFDFATVEERLRQMVPPADGNGKSAAMTRPTASAIQG